MEPVKETRIAEQTRRNRMDPVERTGKRKLIDKWSDGGAMNEEFWSCDYGQGRGIAHENLE